MILKTVWHKGKEILIVDYGNLNEDGMLNILEVLNSYIITHGKPMRVLNIFGEKNFITRKFIQEAEHRLKKVEYLVSKQAITGLTPIRMWILKAFNLVIAKAIEPFGSVEEALDFLAQD